MFSVAKCASIQHMHVLTLKEMGKYFQLYKVSFTKSITNTSKCMLISLCLPHRILFYLCYHPIFLAIHLSLLSQLPSWLSILLMSFMDPSKELSNPPHIAIAFVGLKPGHKEQQPCATLQEKVVTSTEFTLKHF